MIGVKVSDGDSVKRFKSCLGLAKSQKNFATGVDKKPCFSVNPKQVTRTCSRIV
jgi:hypothetical protein